MSTSPTDSAQINNSNHGDAGDHLSPHDQLLLQEGGGFKLFWKILRSKVSELSVLQLIWIIILMIFMMAGNALQLIGLNFWLREFPYEGQSASFTILTMSGIVFALFFIVAFIGYVIVKKPNMNFAKCWQGWVLLTGIGFTDTFNSFMNIYAANYTPEVLQALFQALMPLYTLVMTKYILKDPRSYINRWVVSSFALTVIGIFMAAIPDFISPDDDEDESQADKIGWSFIFFASVPLTALMNVWQTKYMEDYTLTEEELAIVTAGANTGSDGNINNGDDTRSTGGYSGAAGERGGLLEGYGGTTAGNSGTEFSIKSLSARNANGSIAMVSSGVGADGHHHHHFYHNQPHLNREQLLATKGDDATVKLLMLFGDTTIQALMSIALLPADALPWWGGADNVADAAMHFRENTASIFTEWKCAVYCAVYSSGFVFTYIGGAYLNQYSPTLCCMIGQLSSPMTALTLIIIPSWNLAQGNGAWYWSVIAIILLSIGTLLYSAWEEMSSQEEARRERIKENERLQAEREAKNLTPV